MEKKSVVFSVAVTTSFDHDISGARNIHMLLSRTIQKENCPEVFCCSKK
jgi:hypothetical protein